MLDHHTSDLGPIEFKLCLGFINNMIVIISSCELRQSIKRKLRDLLYKTTLAKACRPCSSFTVCAPHHKNATFPIRITTSEVYKSIYTCTFEWPTVLGRFNGFPFSNSVVVTKFSL